MLLCGNELCQIHLITGAPHGVNPKIARCVSIHGEDLRTSCCESFYAYAWKSLVLCYTHGNELRQIHLITGAPHGVNPSFLNNLLDVCLYMGRIYAFLVKYQSDGVLLFNEKYVNHSHVYKL